MVEILRRRTLIAGAAWATPVVAATAAAPRLSASPGPLDCPTCLTTQATTNGVTITQDGPPTMDLTLALQLAGCQAEFPGLEVSINLVDFNLLLPGAPMPWSLYYRPPAPGFTTIGAGVTLSTVTGPVPLTQWNARPSVPDQTVTFPALDPAPVGLIEVRYFGQYQYASGTATDFEIVHTMCDKGDRTFDQLGGFLQLDYQATSCPSVEAVCNLG